MNRIEQINLRMAEIAKEIEKDDADIEALSAEVDALQAEKKALIEKAETRKATLARIAQAGGITVVERASKAEEREENVRDSAEYRSAFLKNLQGKKLEAAEERTLTSAKESAGAVLPTTTLNLVMQRVEEAAPLLQEIELMRVNGNVSFAVEADKTDANVHIEGATITEDGDVLVPVDLGSYEITKYITVSKTVANMSVDAFEKWLANMLARRIARKITKLIISGSGEKQPKGIEKANTWDDSNSVTVAAGTNLTEANITDLTAKLPGGYDANAKWLMSKKTLLGDFRPLQNKSKNDIFVKENGKYFVEGYEVMLDDSVAAHEAYLGDFKMYAGNLGEDVTVETDKILSKNSFEFLGCANFDGTPAIGEAFVKLAKATA